MRERLSHCKGVSKDKKLNIARRQENYKGMTMKGLPRNNQIFIFCWLQWSWQWACIARSDNKNYIFFVPWYHTTRLIAARKCVIVPCNNQPFLIDCWSNQNDCKGAKAPVIKNVYHRQHREWNGQKFYTILQGAKTSVDHKKHVRSCKQQPTFFINVNQPHWWLQRCKVPAINLIVMPWQQRCQGNTYFLFLLYCKEQGQWNYKWSHWLGKAVQTVLCIDSAGAQGAYYVFVSVFCLLCNQRIMK
jgi:hypothetical protein